MEIVGGSDAAPWFVHGLDLAEALATTAASLDLGTLRL